MVTRPAVWLRAQTHAVGCILVLLLSACSGGGGKGGGQAGPAVIEAVELSPAAPSLAAGLSVQLAATARLSDATSSDATADTTFTTSAPSVVLVSDGGLLFAMAPGTATITATHAASGKVATATVTVNAAALEAVTIDPDVAVVALGHPRALAAEGRLSDGSIVPLTGGLEWTTSAAEVAAVSPAGVVTGVAAGTATITVRHVATGLSVSVPARVTDATLQSLALEPGGDHLFQGNDVQVQAIGQFSDGTSAPLSSGVEWTGDDETIATVAGGLVTGVSAGATMITARHGASGVQQGEWFYVYSNEAVSLSDLPADTSVSNYGLYRVEGVTPGAWYEVRLAAPSADVSLYVSERPDAGWAYTGSLNPGTADESCVVMAHGTALYVIVDGPSTPATFTLDVRPSAGPGHEVLAFGGALPHAAALADGEPRVFEVTGLTPGGYYLVALDGLEQDADLYVYGDAELLDYRCASWASGTVAELCAVVAPASGKLWVEADPWGGATAFTLDVGPLAPPEPLLAGGLPAQLHAAPYAVFVVGGLAPGAPYTVSLGGLSGEADLRLFTDAALTDDVWCDSSSELATAPRSCVAWPEGSRLFVAVGAPGALATVDATLDVRPLPPPSLAATLDFWTALPLSGEIAQEPLHYRITGLLPGAPYRVTLDGLAADVDLSVYRDADFGEETCSSSASGTAADSCTGEASAAGDLYVRLAPYAPEGTTFPGSAFTLDVPPFL